MKKIKFFLVLIGLLAFSNIYSQVVCGTPQTGMGQNSFGEVNFINSNPICINVQFHIVKETNGNGGASLSQLDQIVSLLNNHFNPHNIFIKKLGFDVINNSSYYNMSDSGFNSLVAINNVPNAINFYLINNSTSWAGRAGAILSKNLVMMNSYSTTGVAAHEVGHCLNLWHTFQGTASGTSGCAELINGSNCATCGDYICDTPADANIGATGGYNPDLTNDMSYSTPSSLTHFSIMQGDRMRSAINNSSILSPIVSNQCSSIDGANSICLNTNKSYTLSNLNGSAATWSVTGNLQIVSSTTTSVTIKGTSNVSSTGTLIATLSSGQVITKSILIGVPTLPNINNNYINAFGWYYAGLTLNNTVSVPASASATSYRWTLELADVFSCNTALGRFTNNGSTVTTLTPAQYISTTPTASINWANCSAEYILTCYAVNACGETAYYPKYISVNKSNPCYDTPTAYSKLSVGPNPIKSGEVIVVNIRQDQIPCNPPGTLYKSIKNSENYNFVKIYDMLGNLVFSNKYQIESDTFSITETNLKSGNYILNVTFSNGITEKKIIVVQ